MNYIIILIFLLIVAFFIILNNYKEAFDDSGSEFLPLGYIRYGLRGERLNTRPINDCYWDQYHCYTSTHNPKFTPYDMNPRMLDPIFVLEEEIEPEIYDLSGIPDLELEVEEEQ